MSAGRSLIAELEAAIKSGSKDKRVETLRRITDLFVVSADRLNDRQIEVFDDVLGYLVKRIEDQALAELSTRLGPIANAPTEVVRRLARHDHIEVAHPVLTQSARLSDEDLIEIAKTKTQAHLLAISGRAQIDATVTDALLQRGDRQVFHKLAANNGARFSEAGFGRLVKHSENDERLAEKVGLRLDVPLKLFHQLLMRATEAVRTRLLAVAGPESRAHIQQVLAHISEDVEHEASLISEQDYANAQVRARMMHIEGRLNEKSLFEAAKADRCADVVAMLSLLCEAPMPLVQNLLQNGQREAFLIPCKAAWLSWRTVNVMLTSRTIGRSMSGQDLETARKDYTKLSASSAQRVLRFWQIRNSVSKGDAAETLAGVANLVRR